MTETPTKTEHVKTMMELLGLEEGNGLTMASATMAASSPPAAGDFSIPIPEILPEFHGESALEQESHEIVEPEPRTKTRSLFNREWVRYPLIFVGALGFFYLIFNFRGLTEQFLGSVNPPKPNQEAVLGSNIAEFTAWIPRYYVMINKPDIIAANNDKDGDGLTNMDEFYMFTNPFSRDTDRDGTPDGREVLIGTNPLYDGGQTAGQGTVIAKNLDLGAIEARGAYNSESAVSGENVSDFVVDTSLLGEILIPRLDINASVVWSSALEDMEEDLKNGAAHHPETPYPGEYGTASIHGHSSGNFDDGDFQNLFTKINLLEPGDEVFVTVYSVDGDVRKYRYIVRSKKVFAKTDTQQFNAGDGYFLNLSTSWPIGTALQRYVVTAELAGL